MGKGITMPKQLTSVPLEHFRREGYAAWGEYKDCDVRQAADTAVE
jgi:hypothetical protein